MDLMRIVRSCFGWLPGKAAAALEKGLRKLPGVEGKIDQEFAGLLGQMEHSVKPYREGHPTFARLPEKGRDPAEVLTELAALKACEEDRWKDGFVSGGVYHGDSGWVDFLCQAYALNSQSNPLHCDIWPSATSADRMCGCLERSPRKWRSRHRRRRRHRAFGSSCCDARPPRTS